MEVTREGAGNNFKDTLGRTANIDIKDHLSMESGGGVALLASNLKAGSLDVKAADSVVVASQALEEASYSAHSGGYDSYNKTTHAKSDVAVAGDVSIATGSDFVLSASSMGAGGNIGIKAAGGVQVVSQVNMEHSESHREEDDDSFFGGGESVEHSSSHNESLVLASLKAGRNLSVESNDEQSYVAADLASGGTAKFKGDRISFLAQARSNGSSYLSSDESLMWQSSESSGSNNTEFVETKLTANGGVEFAPNSRVVAEVVGDSSLRGALSDEAIPASKITFTQRHNQHQSWDESQSGLTQAGSFIVGGLASIATMGAASSLSQAMVLGTNASSSAIAAATTFQTMQIGAISAGLTSAASTIAVGAVNGRVDGKALVQNVLMSAATGGITAGATQAAGLSNISKLQGVDKTMVIAQKVGISTGVGTALDMAVHGKTSKDVLGRLTTSTALALGQNAIGDLSAARGLDEGSLGKTIAHAAVGGALGGTSGAIGGAVSEQMSAHLIDAKDVAGGAKIGLVAGTATMLTGGDVKDMSVASATAASAHEYNAGLHQDAQPILEEYLKDKSPAEQRGYIQALMREKRADAGVSPEDPKYTEIRSDVALGGLVDPQRLENVHQLMASNGMPDASKYTVSDGVSDYFARHDEGFTRTGQIFKIGAGYGGAVASTVTTTAGWAGPWAPFVGPAVTVASNALRVASAAYGLDAAKDFVLPYQHVEGANVLESYRNPVESYASRKGKAVGFDAAMIVSGYGAGQLIGGLAKTGPGQKLVANVVGGKAPVVKGGTTNVVQNGVGDGKVGEVSAGNTLQLKYKTGTNKQHFERKVEALQNLAKDGELKKTTVISRDKQLRDKYRREKMANAKKQFGQQNPEFVQQIKVRLKKSLDADHTHERQLGGADHPKNLRLLDRSVNRSIGAQVAPQIRGLSEGSIITDVVIIK